VHHESPRKAHGAFLAVAALLLISLLFITSREREKLSPVECAIREVLAPVEAVLFRAASGVSGVWRTITHLGHLIRENDRLYLEVSRLLAENARLEEYRLQNDRLRRLLDFQAASPHITVAAEIIARDPGNWLGTVTINKGTRHGVKKNMAVITCEGLVGRVLAATPHTATVLLIPDPRSAVGGLVQRTRALVLVEGAPGTPGMCLVKSLAQDSDIQVGDKVLSSGLGGVYPKGLVVGEVSKVFPGKYGVGQAAQLRPVVDFSRLEEVLVIVGEREP